MTDTTATSTQDEPVEELFAGEPTGVELEVDEVESEIEPWDPEKIRVATKNFSLRHVLDMIESNDLDLAPDFQRNRVWKARQKSRLIESLMLQIPLPAFYFAEDSDGLLRTVDGLQRLSTIESFVRKEDFALQDLEYLGDEHGKVFSKLAAPLQRRLNNAQIVAHVIDPSTPSEVQYDIFKRINTGGEPLNAMEIRHCMSKARSRAFLKACTSSAKCQKATGGVLQEHIRMNDREAALRFAAFRLLGDIRTYSEYGTLERLLDQTARKLDDPTEVSDEQIEALKQEFDSAMENASLVFGDHAFRKWPIWSGRLSPINRALFESWSVALAPLSRADLARHSDEIVALTRKAMTSDYEYMNSISSSTSDPRRVKKRFEIPQAILASAGL